MNNFKELTLQLLEKWGAPELCYNWFKEHNFISWKETWDNMDDPSWMIFLAGNLNIELKLLHEVSLNCLEYILNVLNINNNQLKMGYKYLEGKCTAREMLLSIPKRKAKNKNTYISWSIRCTLEYISNNKTPYLLTLYSGYAKYHMDNNSKKELCNIIRKKIGDLK